VAFNLPISHMAAVSLQLSPHAPTIVPAMTSKRVPLRDAPNSLINSPLRGASTATIGQKRPRTQVPDHLDLQYPQKKKQTIDQSQEQQATARVSSNAMGGSRISKVKYVSLQDDSRSVEQLDQPKKTSLETRDNIRQWQRHYRKVFPSIVFYFESIPDETRARLSGQVKALGAVRQLQSPSDRQWIF
jgi:regulatory subunit for Cdc7p protein kinase